MEGGITFARDRKAKHMAMIIAVFILKDCEQQSEDNDRGTVAIVYVVVGERNGINRQRR
jgi:hypothetical protein